MSGMRKVPFMEEAICLDSRAESSLSVSQPSPHGPYDDEHQAHSTSRS